MSSLRIVIGAETYPPDVNGAARFAERLAGGLVGRGHRVHVVTPSPTGRPGREVRDDGVTVHGVRSHRYFRHEHFQVCMPWEAYPATAALIAELEPDVVHTQAHMVVGRGVVRAAHRAGVPLVATNHLMPENLAAYSPFPRWLQPVYHSLAWKDLGRVFRRADVVTAPTPRAVELLVARAGLRDAIPVSCGIDARRYRHAVAEPTAEPTVLFVGRLDHEKRVDELIRAFSALPVDLPAQLEIVGDGSRRAEWRALAAGLGRAERIRFRGFVSEEELLAAYARAEVFCMPGVAELQSIATLEAMAAGTAVVAADAMALPHLVRPGRNGWLYRPGDLAELGSRLEVLLRDAALRRRMGAASSDLVAAHAFESTLDTFEGIYRQVMGRTDGLRRVA